MTLSMVVGDLQLGDKEVTLNHLDKGSPFVDHFLNGFFMCFSAKCIVLVRVENFSKITFHFLMVDLTSRILRKQNFEEVLYIYI